MTVTYCGVKKSYEVDSFIPFVCKLSIKAFTGGSVVSCNGLLNKKRLIKQEKAVLHSKVLKDLQ